MGDNQKEIKKDEQAIHCKRPAEIKCKIKRTQLVRKEKLLKSKTKKEERKKRKREEKELGDEAPPRQMPKTIDSMREPDETIVDVFDEEIKGDQEQDEFQPYFQGEKDSKIMITTSLKPNRKTKNLIADLMDMIPNSFYYKREGFELKRICKYAANKEFTHLIVLNEKGQKCHTLYLVHLPSGPTAKFKFSSLVETIQIKGRASSVSSRPELILNNFTTRIGHRAGRLLGSLFPQNPHFKSREVVTFHNQRDFIFFRRHRYIFDNTKKARLQEIGPRFTLKLRSLQQGTFDTKFGEYEWIYKTDMDTSRRRFHL